MEKRKLLAAISNAVKDFEKKYRGYEISPSQVSIAGNKVLVKYPNPAGNGKPSSLKAKQKKDMMSFLKNEFGYCPWDELVRTIDGTIGNKVECCRRHIDVSANQNCLTLVFKKALK